MKRASIAGGRGQNKGVGGRTGKRSIALAAAISGMAVAGAASAATVTWNGSVGNTTYLTDLEAALGISDNMPIAHWDTTAANWTGGNYVIGDNAVFTDTFAGIKDIILPTSGMNPTNMTFTDAGAGDVTYRLFTTGDFKQADGTTNVTSNSPFGAVTAPAVSSTLTLDTGFTGTVILRAANNSAALNGNTIIRSGTLEVQNQNALPGGPTRQTANVTLAGGTLAINVRDFNGGNFSPGTTDYTGILTVTADSTLLLRKDASNLSGSPLSSRSWNGFFNVPSGLTLTLKADNAAGDQIVMNTRGSFFNSTGTIKLVDGAQPTIVQMELANLPGSHPNAGINTGAGRGSASAIWDLGTGSSTLRTNHGNAQTVHLGTLLGGAGTTLGGSSATAGTAGTTQTYSIGARNESSTFAGTIGPGTGVGNGTTTFALLTAVNKVGTATLTLTGNNTYNGVTTVSAATLEFAGASGAATASTDYVVNRGTTLRVDNTASSNSNRLSNTAPVTLTGGTLAFVGNLAAPTAESAGALTISSGSGTVQTSAAGVGGTASLTFANLARSAATTVDFGLASGVNIGFTSAPAVTNGIIGAYATADASAWATLSGGAVSAYVHTPDELNQDAANWDPTENVNLNNGVAQTVSVSKTINTLRVNNTDVSINAGQTLNISAGGLLAVGSAGSTIGGAGSLTAGNGASELLVSVLQPASIVTINAPIVDNAGGAVTLVKAGAGKLVLGSNSNSYTGGLTLAAGTLAAGTANFLPAGAGLNISNGATFDLNGQTASIGAVTLIDGSIINSGAPATLTGTSYAVRNGTINAQLTGAGALSKTTAGTVTINAAQTYTGGTTVTAGTLATGALNVLPAAQAVAVTGGGTLDIGAHNQSIGTLQVGVSATTGASSGTVNGTNGVLTASSFDLQQGTIGAVLGGSAALVKGNSGTGNHNGTISGANTYTGGTIINSGTLIVAAQNSLPVGRNVTLTNATSEARLDVGQFNQSIGVLTVEVANSGDNAVRSSTGVISATSVELKNGQIPALLGGSATVNKTTSGVARLGGTGTVNTYTGNTNLNEGTLTVASNAHLGAPSSTLVFNGGTLRSAAAFTGTRSVTVNAGGATFDTNNFDTQFGDVSGTGNLTKNGGGNLAVNHIRTSGNVTLNAAKLTVTPSSLAGGVSKVAALNIAGGATVDLKDNKLITTNAPGTATEGVYNGLQGHVQAAYNFGSWNAPGLTTSMQLALDGIATIGVATGEQIRGLGPTDTDSWAGQTINGASTIAMYTYAGDANLDGQVDAGDYGILDAFIQIPGADGYGNGDFNYDGFIDAADYGTIDNSIQFQGPPIFASGGTGLASASSAGLSGVTAVPEPASLGVLGIAATSMLTRRRRRQH